MDKRLINFMLVSMLLIVAYTQLNMIFFPPPPKPDVEAEFDINDELAQDPGHDQGQGLLAEVDPAPEVPNEPDAAEVQEQERDPATLQRYTIGSVDPASSFPMLITLTSEGAAVERIELSDERYRDLEDKSAYVGHMALETAALYGGVRVNVVGDGTPVAKARPADADFGPGLKVGDLITKVGSESVGSPAAFRNVLQTYKAGEVVELAVLRGAGTPAEKSTRFSLQSTRRPLEVVRAEPTDHDPDHPRHPLSYLLTLIQIGPRRVQFDQDELAGLPSMRSEHWYSQVVEDDGIKKIEFRFPLSRADLKEIGLDGSVEVVKRFWFQPTDVAAQQPEQPTRNYHFDFEIELVNRGGTPIELGYRLDGPTGLPLEGWWYSYKTHPTSFGGAGMRDIVWRAQGGAHQMFTNPSITKKAKKNSDNPQIVIADRSEAKQLQYLGVDAQYFTSSLLAVPSLAEQTPSLYNVQRVVARPVAKVDELRASRTDVTFRVDSVVHQVSPGAESSFKQRFQIFAGPKKPSVLAAYGLEECIVYGWFKWPAKLMGDLLHFFYGIVRSYGIAIILLTVVVRACMFPIGRQQAMNAKKMQELTPEIKKIKEKFPNDMEKQTKAQQELFRKHKYNPVAGCLPMFLQLPIFIGLYRALSVDIELRQTPLIPGIDWCSNLSAPDMFWRWESVIPIQALTGYTGWLGPYFNILPLVSVALFLVHQQMFTPPPTDEQQEMQQRIMKFMTLFIGVLFFKVPAGLCLYFITSSLWALAERKMLPNTPKKDSEQTPVSLTETKATAASGASGASGANGAASRKKSKRKKNRR